jgi:hypothetical protein
MHNNNNYFGSIHNKKFMFYSQLIERYRNIISIKEPIYLFLTSSTLEEKQPNNEKGLIKSGQLFDKI